MKVKELIKELKKMPQDLEVAVAAHDNSEYETQGFVCTVNHMIKEEQPDDDPCDMHIVPREDEWVTLAL